MVSWSMVNGVAQANSSQHHGTYPVNHIAISVPDVVAAEKWYTETLGFHILRARAIQDRAVTPNSPIFTIYPGTLNKVHVAYLSAGNGVGVELFEFMDPKMDTDTQANFEKTYFHGGFFHMAVTVPDLDATCAKVLKAGGRKIGESVPIFGHTAAYVADPWGNVVELITASFERIMSNR